MTVVARCDVWKMFCVRLWSLPCRQKVENEAFWWMPILIDCKPEHLFQFGIMGYFYAKDMYKMEHPHYRICCQQWRRFQGNHQETFSKTSRRATGLLHIVERQKSLPFRWKLWRYVCTTWTFIGNLVLKLLERVASTISFFIQEYIRKSPIAIILLPPIAQSV